MRLRHWQIPVLGLLLALGAACAEGPAEPTSGGTGLPTQTTEQAFRRPATEVEKQPERPTGPGTDPSPAPVLATEPPPWIGRRVLPPGETGFGAIVPTPPELRDRRIRTADVLPPPEAGFGTTVAQVPDDVLARSTWTQECPVDRQELRYMTVAHWGFDGAPHTGELLVHQDVTDALITVFRAAWDARFPIEEMRIVAPTELEAPPTGDGNNTTAFVCRPVRGSSRWSEHAYGLAIDVNPFHNPYVKDSLVLPELASAYVDREWVRPGMLFADGEVVAAFRDVGWHWGGAWEDPVDWMHFSRDGG